MENVAEDVKEFLYEVIIPQFQKDNTKEHTMKLVGEDLEKYFPSKYTVIAQPNAFLSAEEHFANYQTYSRICNR